MRLLLFALVAALCVAGPVYYLTAGADARADRLAELERITRERDEVKRLLSSATPTPSSYQTDRAKEHSQRMERAVQQFVQLATAPLRHDAPSLASLRATAADSRVAPELLAPILAGLTDQPTGAPRRRALAAVLHAVEDDALAVESVDLAREVTTRASVPHLTFLGVELSVVAPTPTAMRCLETLLAGGEDTPCGDLEWVEAQAIDRSSLDRLGRDDESPPVRLHFRVDLIVDPRS